MANLDQPPQDSVIEDAPELANSSSSSGRSSNEHQIRKRALTSTQDRKLTTYLDDHFLQMTRGYKKRSEPTSSLQTLGQYLTAARHLLALILQITPVDPSTSLRTAYLLRLTGEVLGSIPGYSLNLSGKPSPSFPSNPDDTVNPIDVDHDTPSTLRDLLDFLDDLDQAWVAVLQSQVWDPSKGEGVDLVLGVDDVARGSKSSPMSVTEIARLRSLLLGGEAALEEWLVKEKAGGTSEGEGEDDVTGMLQKMGLLDEFEELFSRTLDYLVDAGGYIAEHEVEEDGMEVEE